MVLISDGNSEHDARAYRTISVIREKHQMCDCSQSNALNRSKNRDCAAINELPSHVITMSTLYLRTRKNLEAIFE